MSPIKLDLRIRSTGNSMLTLGRRKREWDRRLLIVVFLAWFKADLGGEAGAINEQKSEKPDYARELGLCNG